MPIYEYEPDSGECERCGGRFECFQSMRDHPHSVCPFCDKPVHRVISRCANPPGNLLSDSNIAEKGLTKYVRTSDGTYEKQAGHGPDLKGGTARSKRGKK